MIFLAELAFKSDRLLGQLKRPESRPTLELLAQNNGPEGKAARMALKKFQAF